MTQHSDHPETIITGDNPLYNVFCPFVALHEVPKLLRMNPIAGIDLSAIPMQRREALLPFAERFFVPTTPNLEVFMGLQELLRRSLSLMDPLKAAARLHVNGVGSARSSLQLRDLVQLDGAGMLITGITGRGKTRLIKRCLDVLVRHLVYDHPDCANNGWYGLRQVAYVYIDFPSNGSRGALLKRILSALDQMAGTAYSEEHKKTTNLDALTVAVCKALINHRVALLVIDEKQSSTFADSPWALQFVLFYLSVMNLGISVALSGNPLAFDHMRSLSQVMRRFSVGGVHDLTPASPTDSWWTKEFLPQTEEFMLVDGFGVDVTWRRETETEFSAGTPGLLMQLRCETMRSAMRRGDSPCLILAEDYNEAFSSPRLKPLAPIGDAIRGGKEAGNYVDLPALEHIRNPSAGIKQEAAQLDAATGATILQLLKKFQIRVSSELTKTRKKLKEIQGLSKEDAEMLGVTMQHINELEANIATMEQHKKEIAEKKRKAAKAEA
jgi:hypothetical protein